MTDYRICTRCVMDTSAPNIKFNAQGQCNFCCDYLDRLDTPGASSDANRDQRLNHLVEQVKREGMGKRYDCIVGVSGGVDSAFALMKVVELGLRPLAVHMDNGWNSELAQNNIANLVKGLDVDLVTHVIEWQEYRELMLAFLEADVIDIELLYDNAMLKLNYQQASRYRLRCILSGSNQATEGMAMPDGWNWFKYDKRNIRAIGRLRDASLRSFPAISTSQYLFYRFVRRISWVSFLDYVAYDKEAALQELESRFGFKRYPYKHYESILTRFYQGYLLPEKFGVDKRRLHLSNLIVSDQLSRDVALQLLSQSPYPNSQNLRSDTRFFLKKAQLTEEDLSTYLHRPAKAHNHYPPEERLWSAAIATRNNLVQRITTRRESRT